MPKSSFLFEQIITELHKLDTETLLASPHSYVLKGRISADGLEYISNVPCEILITANENAEVIVSTGTKSRARHPADLEARDRVYRNVSIHSHPRDGDIIANAPSLSDVDLSEKINAKRSDPRTEYLIHPQGLLVYRVEKNYFEERREFYLRHNAYFGTERSDANVRYVKNIPRAERVALARAFAKRAGLIVKEALWEDEFGITTIVSEMNDLLDSVRQLAK